jgi:hypothetical protein
VPLIPDREFGRGGESVGCDPGRLISGKLPHLADHLLQRDIGQD